MPLIETDIKNDIKAKLLQARENVTDADEAMDLLVDAIFEIIEHILNNAIVTGTCPSGGGLLVNGKII